MRAGIAASLQAHLTSLASGDSFAVLACVGMNRVNRDPLQLIRHRVRDARRFASCLGFGPRFQQFTGQAYKASPNTGVFLQVTHDPPQDTPVPGRRLSFGVLEAAEEHADLAALAERGRRSLRMPLGAEVPGGPRRLDELVVKALG